MDTDKVVLIVDDDHAVLDTMRILLEGKGGYRVHGAVGSKGAAGFISSQPRIDVVVADVILAGETTGIEVGRQAAARHPEVGLVIISADPGVDAQSLPERSMFLRKPFGGHELIAAIERVLAYATLGLAEALPNS